MYLVQKTAIRATPTLFVVAVSTVLFLNTVDCRAGIRLHSLGEQIEAVCCPMAAVQGEDTGGELLKGSQYRLLTGETLRIPSLPGRPTCRVSAHSNTRQRFPYSLLIVYPFHCFW